MSPLWLLYNVLLLSAFVCANKLSLQWAICDRTPQSVLAKFGMPASPPYKENPITYYDETPPIHIHSGLMFRTKTNKGQPLSTVKVRFPEAVDDVPDFVDCSWSQYGDNSPFFTCEKRCPLGDRVWQEEQVQFAEKYRSVDWDALHAYGPYQNPKWKVRIEGYKTKFDDVVAGDLHLMELEVKVHAEDAPHAFHKITKYLKRSDIVLCERQEGKTMRLFRHMGYYHDRGDEL
jgi:hypothetical protein